MAIGFGVLTWADEGKGPSAAAFLILYNGSTILVPGVDCDSLEGADTRSFPVGGT